MHSYSKKKQYSESNDTCVVINESIHFLCIIHIINKAIYFEYGIQYHLTRITTNNKRHGLFNIHSGCTLNEILFYNITCLKTTIFKKKKIFSHYFVNFKRGRNNPGFYHD